jgi:hypothetical protein
MGAAYHLWPARALERAQSGAARSVPANSITSAIAFVKYDALYDALAAERKCPTRISIENIESKCARLERAGGR